VRGRHPWQTSDAVGVAGVQLGPEALTLAAILNMQMGLSLGRTRQELGVGGSTRRPRRARELCGERIGNKGLGPHAKP